MATNREAAIELIRAALVERDEDRITLSRETGLDKAVIYETMDGRRWPRPKSLAKIERHFGWEPGTLQRAADGEDPTPRASKGASIVLEVDPGVVGTLTDAERGEAAAAATAAFMERARQIAAFKS